MICLSIEAIQSLNKMNKDAHTRKRLIELDGVRAIAILMIVGSHLIYYLHLNPAGSENVLDTYLVLFGLGAFFFLSGFVLAYNNREFTTWSDVVRFFKKRLFRIYPLYLVALAIAVCAFALVPRAHFSLSATGVVVYALGLQGLAGQYVPDFYMFWFVGVILLCYVTYPLLIRHARNPPRLLITSVAIFALFLAMRLLFGIIDTRFFMYYSVFVSGVIMSTFYAERLLNQRKSFVGAALALLSVLMFVHAALYSHQLPSDQNYVFAAGQFGLYTDMSLFLVLTAMMLLFVPLLFDFAGRMISLSKLVPWLMLVSYSSYAIFLFNPLILAALSAILTQAHTFQFIRDALLIIVGVLASCVFAYAFQQVTDRTLQKMAL